MFTNDDDDNNDDDDDDDDNDDDDDAFHCFIRHIFFKWVILKDVMSTIFQIEISLI